MLVVGENEEKEGTISVRRRGEGDLGVMKIEDFVAYFKEHQKQDLSLTLKSKNIILNN
jgi:threonyl-tRNA synthetase